MKVIGIDFTSSPRRAKPIICALGRIVDTELVIQSVDYLGDFLQFEECLAAVGPWIAGMDFPFGQSLKLLDNLDWPGRWSDYVGEVSGLSREAFIQLLEDYKAGRPAGDKEHRRHIDVLASSISPQKLYGVPVAKMFYEGARRLLASQADIVPVRRQTSDRVIVEAYPAVIARRFIGRRSYKNDVKQKQTHALHQARQDIIDGLFSGHLAAVYGLSLKLPGSLSERLLADASGDTLDAVLCAIQAAWAWLNRNENYGIPPRASRCEGWIADPEFSHIARPGCQPSIRS